MRLVASSADTLLKGSVLQCLHAFLGLFLSFFPDFLVFLLAVILTKIKTDRLVGTLSLTIIYIKKEGTVSIAHLATTDYHRTGIFLNFLHLIQFVRRIRESLSIDNLSHLAFFQTLCGFHDQGVILLVSLGNLWIDVELQKLVLALTIIIYVEVERLAAVGKVLETKSDSFTLVGSASMFFDCSIYGSVLTVIVNKLPLVSFSARNGSNDFVYLTFLSLDTFASFITADFFLLT